MSNSPTTETGFIAARDALRDRVIQRTLHPQAAAQQFMELTIRSIATAPQDMPRDTLIWMSTVAASFVTYCQRKCGPDFTKPTREEIRD
jgi:hypothetical protein